jgi:RNA polymerase sigma factor (sigma-70 family)
MYQGGDTTQFQRLLDGWAAGDEAARTELLERAAQRLLQLTRRMFRNYPQLRRWEETDDVFQNAILRLYRSLGDVRPDSVRGFFALAATQIRRTLIDLARHHFGPQGAAAHHHSEVRPSERSDDHSGSPGRASDLRLAHGDEPPETLDAWARFHEAVDLLPAEERDAFSLIWYGEATQQEAAALLGVSERTVLRRLVRARLLLHESLRNSRVAFEEAN